MNFHLLNSFIYAIIYNNNYYNYTQICMARNVSMQAESAAPGVTMGG